MSPNNYKPDSLFSAMNSSVRAYAWALQIMGLALAYFITGKLGTFLAIPPGYATAIWPPSGIALAGILIYGYRAWPGIVLGSFLVNLSTSLVAGSPSETLVSVSITLAIGSGASLQAVVGAYLARRYAGFPNSLATEKDVFLLFFFGGLLSTLINSTLAVSILVAAARMPAANFLTNWGTWWMGDALGVFIFTPLALVWAQRPGEPWRNRRMAITLPIIAMFVLTTAAVFYEAQNNSARLKREFDQHAATLNVALEKSVSNHINVLPSLGSFYSASESVDRNKFRIFVEHSLNDFSGIQAISWDQRILFSEREAYERRIRSEGYPNFQIFEKNSDNQIVRAGDRPLYVPIGFVEPFRGNEKALGYDVYSDPVRQEAIDRATDSGEITATAPVILVQEHENRPGILAYLPVYRKGLPYQTLEQRRNNILGYVVAVFRGEDIVTAALKDLNPERLSYRLIDETAPAAERLIFSSDRKQLKPLVLQENGLFGRNFSLASRFAISVGGRSWRFEVVPTQDYFVYHKSDNAWLILLAGLLLTSMVSSFVLVFSGRGNMLRRLVEERTAALAQSEERFRSTFEGAPVGVTNSALDGRFLEVNQGYCDLVGYSRDELLTMTFRQVTHPDYLQSDAALVKRVLAGEISGFNVEKKYVRKNGEVVWGNLSVKLIRHADGSPNHFVAVVENIDRRKQAEAQTAKSLSLLHATLDSSNDAILVVDLNNTWVLHNQRFIDLWHITDEIVAAKDDKAALLYVMDQLNDADIFLKKVHQLYASPEVSSFDILKFKNGKVIERYSIPQRVDGQVVGRVWSFRDITVRKATDELLRKLSLAVEQSPNSVVITDLDGNIEYVNEAFVKITGYSRAEAIGKNPRLLRSGKLPKASYDDMWATLNAGDVWKGEFINTRKEGGEYTESAFISPVRQQDGKITHYVGVHEDITARKQAESLLQESEKRFRNVVDAAPVLIWLAGTDKLCFWFNQVWLDFTGRSMTQELGNGWTNGVHPDDLQRYLDVFASHFDRREAFRIEYRLKRYDGEYRWINDNGVPRFDVDGSFLGYIGSSIDITDSKLAEQKLTAQNLRYQTLLKSSSDGIHIIDLDGNIVDVNEAFCRQLGYSYAEAMKLKVSEWDAQWSAEELLRLLRELIDSGEAKQFETKHRRKDGGIIDVEVNSVPVVVEGRSLLFASARDITERKQNEAVIMLAKERAEALAQSKTDFLANMSHEIRTPMNAIIGLSQLALNKEISAEIRDYLGKIYSSSNSLLSILNDILDFSKLEAGRLTIDHSPFYLDVILNNINNLFTDHAEEKGLDLIMDVAPDVPHHLVGDALRLQQVLINLLGNAIKFTERGKVTLKIAVQQLDTSKTRLLFCVTDTGIGMPDDDREKLFQPFNQIDGSITRRYGGTGLGLAISHNLLQLMGSEFSVASSLGKGSSFGFELVLGVLPSISRHPVRRKPGVSIPAQGDFSRLLAGARILVAEDNLINQKVVREFLNLSGITVEVANNGKEAVALLEQEGFDAVLMDIHMPEMDGFEATKLIRSQARFAGLPVIALTAGVTKEERDRCRISGMNDFVAKPINPKELMSTLIRWLKPEAAATDLAVAEPVAVKLSGMDELPGFDLHNLVTMLGNNQELTTRLLLDFMDSTKNVPFEIEALISVGDLAAARELVHKINGTSGNFGAVRLHAACKALEAELKEEQSAGVAFKTFKEAFDQAMSTLATLQRLENPMSPDGVNIEALKRSADELDLLLKENDFIAEALLNTFKAHLATDQLGLFMRLRKLINDLNYDQARNILRQLVDSLPPLEEQNDDLE